MGMIPPIPIALKIFHCLRFNVGGSRQRPAGSNEVPRTTFLLTVNFKLDDDLWLVVREY